MGRRREYTPEFRAATVQMVRTSGQSVRSIALDLGVSNQMLGVWIRQFEASDSAPLAAAERQELVELRRRVRTLEAERDILKKAAAFFAQESDRTP